MPLNPARAGHTYPPAPPYLVGREKIREFAEAMGADPELGLDFSRVLHGDQRFSYTRPVRAGDRLTCTTTIETITSRAGSDMITSRTDMIDEDGEPVVSAWSILVMRGV